LCIEILPLKSTLKYLVNVDNDNNRKSCSFQSILVFAVQFAQKAALLCNINGREFPHSRECTDPIWNRIFIALAIVGICIIIEKLSVWKQKMYTNTPG